MSSTVPATLISRVSSRGGIGLIIGAAHLLAIWAISTAAPVRAVFDQTPIEASIIEAPVEQTEAPPPPPPQVEPVQLPTMEPPLVTITEEPAPTAITMVKSEDPAPPPAPVQGTPHVITDVAYLQPPAPKYPMESQRSGEHGLVVLKVLINELGRAARIDVEKSSGYLRLDQAAKTAVERALFKPYVENGVPRMALAMIPVEFTGKSHSASRSGRS
jgi:protein TonB